LTCSFPFLRFVVPSIDDFRPMPTLGSVAISGGQ